MSYEEPETWPETELPTSMIPCRFCGRPVYWAVRSTWNFNIPVLMVSDSILVRYHATPEETETCNLAAAIVEGARP